MDAETPHRYLQYLKFFYEHETVTRKEIQEVLGLDDAEFHRCIPSHVANTAPSSKVPTSDPNSLWIMNQESFLAYLDYLELKEARESSKSAKKWALAAIVISGFLALAAIVLSVYQMNSTAEVRLVQSQVEELRAGGHQESVE